MGHIVFCDGFDHLSTTELWLNLKWTAYGGAPVLTAGAGRRSTQALVAPNGASNGCWVAKTLPADPSWGISVAFKPSVLPETDHTRSLIALLDDVFLQVELAWNDLGQLVARHGDGTVLATAAGGPTTGTFRSLEWQAVIGHAYTQDLVASAVDEVWGFTRASGDFTTESLAVGQVVYVSGFTLPANNGAHVITAIAALVLSVADVLATEIGTDITYGVGMVRARLDQAVVLEALGVETQNSANAAADTVRLGPTDDEESTTYTWDDLVVQQGATLQLIGDVAVDACYPTGNATISGWTGGYDLIDDLIPDSDSTVMTGQGVGLQSTVAIESIPTTTGSGIHALVLNLMARADVEAEAALAGLVIGHEMVGVVMVEVPGSLSAVSLQTSYQVSQHVSDTDPGTGEAWTQGWADLAAWGVEIVA